MWEEEKIWKNCGSVNWTHWYQEVSMSSHKNSPFWTPFFYLPFNLLPLNLSLSTILTTSSSLSFFLTWIGWQLSWFDFKDFDFAWHCKIYFIMILEHLLFSAYSQHLLPIHLPTVFLYYFLIIPLSFPVLEKKWFGTLLPSFASLYLFIIFFIYLSFLNYFVPLVYYLFIFKKQWVPLQLIQRPTSCSFSAWAWSWTWVP